MKTIVRIAIAATVLTAAHVHAQSRPFCGGKLVADSFYSTVSSDGTRSYVTYMLQLRNTTANSVTYSVFFEARQTSQRVSSTPATLQKYQSATIKLGVDTLGNPSGMGKLDARNDVPAYTRIVCK